MCIAARKEIVINMKNKKIIISLAAFAAIIALAAFSYNKLSQSALKKADDFTVVDENGKAVKLSNFNGKPVVVNFWATWCGPCKSEMPAFENLYSRYKNDIDVMMVNMTDGTHDTVEKVKEFVTQNGFTFPVYFDTKSDAANTYSVFSIPMTLFIDKDGNMVNTHKGAMSEKTLNSYVINLLDK